MSVHTFPSDWKLPFNLAVGLHLVVLLAAMFLPQFLRRPPILPEVTVIDLVSMEEPSASKEAAAPAAKPAAKTAAKPVAKEEAAPPPPLEPPAPPKPAEIIKPEIIKQIPPPIEKPIPVPEPAVTPEPVAPPAPVEAISLKPLKQKVKKEIKEIPDKRVEEAKVRRDELKNIAQQLQEEAKKEAAAQETIKQQRQLAAAREQARRADMEARLAMAEAERAAAEARKALSGQLRAGSSRNASSSANSGGAQTMGVLEQQYYATIVGHVKQYWQPPDVKSWDRNLLAIVSISIAADGRIVSQTIEKESGDKLFDQFVLKTLEAANPLPAPPPALQKQRMEIGLRFKPNGIQ